MPRSPHALKFREWALGYSPSQLRRIAVRRWELFVSCFGKPLAPGVLKTWRAVVLGEERATDQQSDQEPKSGLWNDRYLEESVLLISLIERLQKWQDCRSSATFLPFRCPWTTSTFSTSEPHSFAGASAKPREIPRWRTLARRLSNSSKLRRRRTSFRNGPRPEG